MKNLLPRDAQNWRVRLALIRAGRVYSHRTARRHRDNRHSGGDSVPRFCARAGKRAPHQLFEQSQAIGFGRFLQYTQDYDEAYPLSSYPATNVSWTTSTQPYIKSLQIYRCPSDSAARWDAPVAPPTANYYTTSYIMNAWFAGTQPYAKLSAVGAPSKVIVVADANTDSTQRDHFHPFYWVNNDPDLAFSGFMHGLTFDDTSGATKELALARHLETFNALYADGHAKAQRWSQIWYQDAPNGVYEGAFDPRQK